MKNIVIFASGRGSNAQKIITYFRDSDRVNITCIIASKKTAGVLDLAAANEIPSIVLEKNSFIKTDHIVETLNDLETDLIILAGFLWKIPPYLVKAFPKKIVNIHPALLPKYGGKGMYGHHIHKAVKKAGDLESGITIHYVNEIYDDGEILFQTATDITSDMTADDIGAAVLKLEHEHFPKIIDKILFP